MKKILFINFSDKVHTPFFKRFSKKYNFNPCFCKFKELTISENLDISYKKESLGEFDCVLLGIMSSHQEFGSYLETYLIKHKIKYIKFGEIYSSWNKLNEYVNLKRAGLPLIDSRFFYITNDNLFEYLSSIQFPYVIKPINGSKGYGVNLIKDKNDLEKTVGHFIDLFKKEKKYKIFIQQKYIQNHGDYRVLVIGSKVIGAILRFSNDLREFRNNLSLGGSGKNVDLNDEIVDLSLSSAKAVGAEICGVDIMQSSVDGKYYILEVNRAPQFRGFFELTGIDVIEEIIKYVLKK